MESPMATIYYSDFGYSPYPSSATSYGYGNHHHQPFSSSPHFHHKPSTPIFPTRPPDPRSLYYPDHNSSHYQAPITSTITQIQNQQQPQSSSHYPASMTSSSIPFPPIRPPDPQSLNQQNQPPPSFSSIAHSHPSFLDDHRQPYIPIQYSNYTAEMVHAAIENTKRKLDWSSGSPSESAQRFSTSGSHHGYGGFNGLHGTHHDYGAPPSTPTPHPDYPPHTKMLSAATTTLKKQTHSNQKAFANFLKVKQTKFLPKKSLFHSLKKFGASGKLIKGQDYIFKRSEILDHGAITAMPLKTEKLEEESDFSDGVATGYGSGISLPGMFRVVTDKTFLQNQKILLMILQKPPVLLASYAPLDQHSHYLSPSTPLIQNFMISLFLDISCYVDPTPLQPPSNVTLTPLLPTRIRALPKLQSNCHLTPMNAHKLVIENKGDPHDFGNIFSLSDGVRATTLHTFHFKKINPSYSLPHVTWLVPIHSFYKTINTLLPHDPTLSLTQIYVLIITSPCGIQSIPRPNFLTVQIFGNKLDVMDSIEPNWKKKKKKKHNN